VTAENSRREPVRSHTQILAELHDRFDARRETSLEEQQRRQRKEPHRKLQAKPNNFKNHHSSGSSSALTLSAGNNASAQAIFKKKRLKRLAQRRGSTESSSSGDDLAAKVNSFGQVKLASLFEGIRPTANDSGLTTTYDLGRRHDQNRLGGVEVVTNASQEKLIPLDLEVEQLDISQGLHAGVTCHDAPPKSDLGSEPLISKNSRIIASVDLTKAQMPAGFLRTEETPEVLTNNILVNDSDEEVHLQPLSPQTLLERKH